LELEWTVVDQTGDQTGLDHEPEWTVESGLKWTVDCFVDCSGPQTIKSRLKWNNELM